MQVTLAKIYSKSYSHFRLTLIINTQETEQERKKIMAPEASCAPVIAYFEIDHIAYKRD